MQNCCGEMGQMMWLWMIAGIAPIVVLIIWIVKQTKK